jgi:hypothetical protein
MGTKAAHHAASRNASTTASQDTGFAPIYHPAGGDVELRLAMDEVRASRWTVMRDLLADRGWDWATRTFFTHVLGAAAAGTNAVSAWLVEEPTNPDALVMAARVATARALRADQLGHRQRCEFVQRALAACEIAAQTYPQDPVPWVCRLALARITREHSVGPRDVGVPGPWHLLDEARIRDPYNREAHLRMLWALAPREHGRLGPMFDTARFLATRRGMWASSPVRALALYAWAEYYRRHRGETVRADLYVHQEWRGAEIRQDIALAYDAWLASGEGRGWLTVDHSHLAHALWASEQKAAAGAVFAAMGRHAAELPWAHVARGDPHREFLLARAQSLAAAEAQRDYEHDVDEITIARFSDRFYRTRNQGGAR